MSKTDVKLAWTKVGDELSGLGLKLKYHAQQEFSGDDDDAESSADVKDALKRLAAAIDDAVDAVGNAAKDPAVRTDVKNTGQSLLTALTTTVNEAITTVKGATSKPQPPAE